MKIHDLKKLCTSPNCLIAFICARLREVCEVRLSSNIKPDNQRCVFQLARQPYS